MHHRQNNETTFPYGKKGDRQLNGKDNKLLHTKIRVDSNYTAAWADASKIYSKTNVTAPSEDQIDEAKDWVDNGSKL